MFLDQLTLTTGCPLGCLEGIHPGLGHDRATFLDVGGVVANAQVPLGCRIGAGGAVEILIDLLGVVTSLTGLHNRIAMTTIVCTALPGHEHTIYFSL
jgi:hypothetical protein